MLTGSCSDYFAAVRREAARRSETGIVQVVAASAAAVLALEVAAAAEEVEFAGVAEVVAHMVVGSIGGWARDHIQILGRRFAVFGVLYHRIAAGAGAGADAGVAVVAAGGGTFGPFPAETDGATARRQVTGGFHGSQNVVWL